MVKNFLIGLVIFVLGALAASLVLGTNGLTGTVVAIEQPSPADRVSEDDVRVLQDRVILEVEGVEWARFADSNSMDPLFDEGANALQIVPDVPEDIQVGDIITYYNEDVFGESYVIHRVVYVGEDEGGIYYVVKGDNNRVSDPGKVRFEQIDRVLIGILY